MNHDYVQVSLIGESLSSSGAIENTEKILWDTKSGERTRRTRLNGFHSIWDDEFPNSADQVILNKDLAFLKFTLFEVGTQIYKKFITF